ncbi:hypothetical protein MLD38_038716 [Melastoma candidum]|uniref:Uncharacterized protein n=1 Tax=Melastoma candidum TaxID=119954 RepID=A0ACB9L192_9MYRT|nr:hypothetical protein MLD38_038716 [Melastoma candidum]
MKLLVTLAILSLAAATSLAYDPDLLQDICVAINNINDGVFVNGKFCKDPKMATADDFLFTGLALRMRYWFIVFYATRASDV